MYTTTTSTTTTTTTTRITTTTTTTTVLLLLGLTQSRVQSGAGIQETHTRGGGGGALIQGGGLAFYSGVHYSRQGRPRTSDLPVGTRGIAKKRNRPHTQTHDKNNTAQHTTRTPPQEE